MPTTIKNENWDGVVAPAIPSGWTVATNFVTETTAFTSSPNGIKNTATASTDGAYYSSLDGNGGDARTTTTAWATGTGSTNCIVDTYCRMTAASANTTGLTSYMARMHFASNAVQLWKYVAGSATQLGSNVSVTLGTTDKYKVQLTTSGTTISVQIQRVSDSNYLTSAGTWQVGATNCFSVTDSSVTGQGRAGVLTYRGAVGDLPYSDDFLFESLAAAAATLPRSILSVNPPASFYGE